MELINVQTKEKNTKPRNNGNKGRKILHISLNMIIWCKQVRINGGAFSLTSKRSTKNAMHSALAVRGKSVSKIFLSISISSSLDIFSRNPADSISRRTMAVSLKNEEGASEQANKRIPKSTYVVKERCTQPIPPTPPARINILIIGKIYL